MRACDVLWLRDGSYESKTFHRARADPQMWTDQENPWVTESTRQRASHWTTSIWRQAARHCNRIPHSANLRSLHDPRVEGQWNPETLCSKEQTPTRIPLELSLNVWYHSFNLTLDLSLSNIRFPRISKSNIVVDLMDPSSHTIAIIGAGSVGSAIAESILLRRVVADVILVDIDEERCRGQVLDLNDVACLSGSRVRQGTYKDASHAAVIVISAGAKQNPRDTRLDLIERNLKILKAVLEAMIPIRNDAILLIVANPVDILTFFAQRLSGLTRNQVLGSGTLLDSIRLRGIIASRLGVRRGRSWHVKRV